MCINLQDRRRKMACCAFVVYLLVILPICGLCAIGFMQRVKLTFSPPPDSLVQRTDNYLKKFEKLAPAPLFIIIESTNGSQLQYTEELTRFTENVYKLAYSNPKYASNIYDFEGYFTALDIIKPNLITPDNKTSLISINYHAEDDVIGEDYSLWLEGQLNSSPLYNLNSSVLSWEITGLGLLVNDITSGTGADFIRIDTISLPLAIMVLAYCLKSLRVLFIPLVCLPLSVSMSFAVMLPFTYFMDVSAFTPDMMGAMISALNIDYALFLLSRFQEQCSAFELFDLKSVSIQYTIVKRTTVLAAHNIIVSGVTVAMANAGIAVFPMDMLRTIGIGCALAVLCTIVVSMTVTPLMLFLFFEFFSKRPNLIPDSVRKRASQIYYSLRNIQETETASMVDMDDSEERKGGLISKDEINERNYQSQLKSPWYRLARATSRHPLRVLIVVIAIGIPMFVFVPKMKVSFDLFVQIPRDAKHLGPFRSLMDQFGAGKTSPYYILINSGHVNGIRSESCFQAIQDATYRISAQSGQPVGQFMSIATLPGLGNISWAFASNLLKGNDTLLSLPYQLLWNQTVTNDSQWMLVNLFTTFAPIGTDAKPFLDAVIPYLEDYKDPRISYIGMSGGGSDSWAVMQWVMEWFPYQIGSTFAVIFLFIGIAFRSIAVPARMIFTVGYTVAFTYGLAVIVFEYEWLDSAWVALKGVNGIFWIVPIQSFTVICGLALDYDVFLLSRVIEYRKKGFEDNAALAKSVWKTGRIISFAGMIMAIAFSSLVFSQIMVMNQAGLMLAVAVMLDTFIIRTLFTPALMSLFPRYVFWPAKLPPGHRGVEDMGEDDPDDEEDNDLLPTQ